MGLASSLADTVLSGSMLLAIPIAMLAGLVSFASPCVVPLVPGYLGYVTGMAGAGVGANNQATNQASSQPSKPRLLLGVLLFVLGFTVVFLLLGAGVFALGAAFAPYQDVVLRVLGVVVIVMGMVFMGAVPFMQAERRVHMSPRAGIWGAPLLGATFGLGWAPCTGPTLAAVLTLGLGEATLERGAILIVAYCLGLGLPFLALALAMEKSPRALAWLRKHRRTLMQVGGALLIVLGILLVTGAWQWVTGEMQGWIDGFWVSV